MQLKLALQTMHLFVWTEVLVPVHTLCTQLSSATDFELIFQTSSVLATARALLMGFTVCLAKL